MIIRNLHPVPALMAACGPLLLFIVGIIPGKILSRIPSKAAVAGSWISFVALCAAAIATVALAVNGGAGRIEIPLVGPAKLCVYFDSLSAILLILVSFLLTVVMKFSINYMAGDPGQVRFFKWLSLTGASTLGIMISGNLIQFAILWSATSLCLHKLLVFYPDRSGAILAARKKFIISRLGDICLIAAIVLVYREFHTCDFSSLFAQVDKLRGAANPAHEKSIIGFLLAAGAMMKSAQFPFHSWLPDTMETPTPVSALMHAGIINAGGFLVIRLNPLVTLSPGALLLLALAGAFTALFASMVMLTHASIKRALAFSTVAQMGFMMLECGLGAFQLALLHLVAHSLYKAHAFLSSGSMVAMAGNAWTPSVKPGAHPLALAASLIVASCAVVVGSRLTGGSFRLDAGNFLLNCTFTMALAYMIWNLWATSPGPKLILAGIIISIAASAAYFELHTVSSGLIAMIPVSALSSMTIFPGLQLAMTGVLLALFLLVLLVQAGLPEWSARPAFQKLYVHARNGFYFNTIANRCVATLWPVKQESSATSL